MSVAGLINYNKFMFEKKFVIKDDWGQVIGYQNMDELHNILYKSALRRTQDLLNLPEKIYKQEWLEMSKEEQYIFNQVIGVENSLDLDKIDVPEETLAIITRMRQAAVACELLTSKSIPSTKFNRLNDILEEAKLNNQKVLVFCPFTQALELGLEYCKEYNPKLVKGGMGDKVWDIKEEHENAEGFSVLFAQEKTLGVGFTLINTDIIVFLSPPWSRGDYDQCVDRSYRLGRGKKLLVIDLYMANTYDELINKKLWGKGAMSDILIDGSEEESARKFLKEAKILFNSKEKSSSTILDGIV